MKQEDYLSILSKAWESQPTERENARGVLDQMLLKVAQEEELARLRAVEADNLKIRQALQVEYQNRQAFSARIQNLETDLQAAKESIAFRDDEIKKLQVFCLQPIDAKGSCR